MSWSAPADSQILAIHAALTPTDNGDGEIVYFGGDQHNPAFINSPRNVDASRRMNCASHAIAYVRSPTHDLFCCGHAQLADGRLLIAGGTAYFPQNIPPGADPHGHGGLGHFPGHRSASVYSPAAGTMTEVASMRPNPGQPGDEGGGRWYPTLVTLASGDVLIMAGHPAETDTRHNNNTPERYRPVLNSWKTVGTLGVAGGGPDLYPRLHLLRNGEVFCSSHIGGVEHCFAYNAYTGGERNVCDLPAGDYHGFGFPSVLLPLLPGDDYRPRLLLCGAPAPQRIALDRPDGMRPQWGPAGARTIAAGSRMRRFCLAVMLPTGQVVIVGGVNGDDPGNDDSSHGVRQPELYDPQIDWNGGGAYVQSGTNQDAQGTWTTENDAAAVTRNYHSTALLMPDGAVWTAGSSINGHPGDPATTGRLTYEIYQPPYPAGARPVLQDAPRFVAWGQSFTIRCNAPNSIRRVALLRCGSCTHAFDGDQRYVGLRFDGIGEGRLQCEAPPNGAVAPPGAYMLFVIDEAGRPCQRARFVRLGGSAYMVLNRSQFAREEVSTLSPRIVGDAILLVLDGHVPADLALPAGPHLTFHFADGGGVVPGMHGTLLDARSETGGFTPGVAQRFVLEYGVTFDNLDAFNNLGTDNRRDVIVDTVLTNNLQLRGTVTLFRDAKPYMKDGDEPWLSIDVRVVQKAIGVPLAGIAHTDANAGTGFVGEVLNRLNMLPRDDNHPFARLSGDQDASRLELSSHVGGVRVFNYAFARVRYRAPVGRNAVDVRLFFRTLTTVGTSFEYNDTTLYRRAGNGPSATPQFGMIGARTASIPYFATPRSGDRLAATDPPNVQTFNGQDAAEVTRFFGAWLDFNQRDDLRDLIRGEHQCLIAELHFPSHSSIPRGAAPAEHDSLSQRNLAIVESDNPGGVAGHVVQHTFELAPFNLNAPAPGPKVAAIADIGEAALAALVPDVIVTPPVQDPMGPGGTMTRQGGLTTELMIRWGTLPRDAIATIYLPDVDFASLLEATVHRAGYELLELVDANTVRCRIGEVTFLPVPAAITRSLPGMISIGLPPTVRVGQRFRVTAHQVSGGPLLRKITGSFEFEIPVSTGPLLLARESRKLAVLRWVQQRLGDDIAWRLVFERYLGQIADRVRAFGGNPDMIKPSSAGADQDQPRPPHDGDGNGDPCPPQAPWNDGDGDDGKGTPVRGRIVAVHYDCYGRFVGFDLDTCPGLRRLEARGKVLEVAVVRAATDGVKVTVTVCAGDRACGLTVHY